MATLTLILQFLPYILQIIQLVESLFANLPKPATPTSSSIVVSGENKKATAMSLINPLISVSGQSADANMLGDIIDIVVGVLNATGTFKHSTK